MNDKTYEMLKGLVDRGTDLQKKHAVHRLSLPDAVDYEQQQLEYPSLIQQAKSAVQAAKSVVSSVVHGEPVSVSTEEQDRRLAICHSCEFWDSGQSRCSKCGCFGRFKTWLVSQKCPVDKW